MGVTMYEPISTLSELTGRLQQIAGAFRIVLEGLEDEGYAPTIGKDSSTISHEDAVCFMVRYPLYHDTLTLLAANIDQVIDGMGEQTEKAMELWKEIRHTA